jgi:hypothetical protein
MGGISKINSIALANIAKVDGVAIANVAKVNSVTVQAAGPSFTTDKLLIWYDASLESSGATTLSNRVDGTLTGAIVQDGHGAGIINGGSVASIDSTQAVLLDGVNDSFYKRAMFSALDGSGEGNHGTSTFGVLKGETSGSSATTDPSTQAFENTGFTIEVWYRTNGSFRHNGNLWAMYSNNGIRTRFSSSGVRWFYMQNAGVMSSGWGTYSANTWYHDVTTISAPGADGSSSGNHTLKLYVNGSLVQGLTSKNLSPSSYVRDLMLFGAGRIAANTGYEAFRGYYAIVRVYHKALSSSEVTTNYNAEKSRYGY